MPARASIDLQTHLDALVAGANYAKHVQADPVRYVHAAPASEREFVGLIAASLAFGNVVAVRKSIERALALVDGAPHRMSRSLTIAQLRARFDGFVHRTYRGADVAALLSHAAALDEEHGSLGAAFADFLEQNNEDLHRALSAFADALRGPRPSRGLAHLVPDPRKGSACKRLLLYLRWMIRPADGVDLGLWPVSPSTLVIPVDTHVLRIARNLGLTRRKDASWKTAAEITARLAQFHAADPVRYDFALCHFGISRACPSRRDEIKCASCAIRSVCRVWDRNGGRGVASKPSRKLFVKSR